MDREEKRAAVYQKAVRELMEYRKWLLTLPPEEMLHHTDNYTAKNSIVSTLSYVNLTDEQFDALINSPHGILNDIKKDIDKMTSDAYQEYAETAISERATKYIGEVRKEELNNNRTYYAIVGKVKSYPEFLLDYFQDPIEAREVAQGLWKGLSEDRQKNIDEFYVIKTTEKNIKEKKFNEDKIIFDIKEREKNHHTIVRDDEELEF